MLLQFSVSNYRSLRGLQTLSLEASNYDKTLPENTSTPALAGIKSKKWLKGAALYGANASGKSTVIEAMRALSDFVRTSAKTTAPDEEIKFIEPYALDPYAANEPTAFAITFVAEGVRYQYRVAATINKIHHESLRAWPHGKEQIWFERDWDEATQEHVFTPENPTGFPRNRDIEKRTLRNVLYLSKSIAEARKEVEPVYMWLVRKFRFLDLSTRANFSDNLTLKQISGGDSGLKDKILTILKHADIGVVDARAVALPPPDQSFSDIIRDTFGHDIASMMVNEEPRYTYGAKKQPQLYHKAPQNTHVPLQWQQESAGTHRLFSLIGHWLDILKEGDTVCIDEIETSMHPGMVRELLKLFFSKDENPKGAQVIFTTHNPLLLDNTLLRRDQIWFTDKDHEGMAHLYPLTDYQPRQGESLVRGYMAGRYGAIPFIPQGLLGKDTSGQVATEGE